MGFQTRKPTRSPDRAQITRQGPVNAWECQRSEMLSFLTISCCTFTLVLIFEMLRSTEFSSRLFPCSGEPGCLKKKKKLCLYWAFSSSIIHSLVPDIFREKFSITHTLKIHLSLHFFIKSLENNTTKITYFAYPLKPRLHAHNSNICCQSLQGPLCCEIQCSSWYWLLLVFPCCSGCLLS